MSELRNIYLYRVLVTIHLEPVGTDQVLLIEHRVVGAQEVEVLKLQQEINILDGGGCHY